MSRYIEINQGLDKRINVSHAMHPIGPDECDVYSSLVDSCSSAYITSMPNHCITAVGEVEGYRFECLPTESAACLPIPRKMFFSTSMVECIMEDSGGKEDAKLLKLLLHSHNVKGRLLNLVRFVLTVSLIL